MKRVLALCTSVLMMAAAVSCEKIGKNDSQSDIVSGSAEEKEPVEMSESADSDEIVPYIFNDEKIEIPDDIGFHGTLQRLENGEYVIKYINKDMEEGNFYKVDKELKNFAYIDFLYPDACDNYDYCGKDIFFNNDGSFNVLFFLQDHGGEKNPNNWTEDYKTDYVISSYDKSGNLQNSSKITFPDECMGEYGLEAGPLFSHGEYVFFSTGKFEETATTNILYRVSCKDGEFQEIYRRSVESADVTYPTMLYDNDGKVILSIGESDKDSNMVYNFYEMNEDGSFSKPVYTDKELSYSKKYLSGFGDYRFCASDEEKLVGIKADGTTEKIIDYTNSGLREVSPCYYDKNEYLALVSVQSLTGQKMNLVKLTPAKKSQFENKEILTLGCFGLYSDNGFDFRELISKFNKTSEKCTIQIVNYFDFEEVKDAGEADIEKAARDKLYKDLISGNAPDIFMNLDYGVYKSLMNKGVFADLEELMEADEKYGRDKFLPNVITAMSDSKGVLYGLPSGISCKSNVVKTKFWAKNTWTLDEMISFYDNAPDTAVHLYDNKTKMETFKDMVYTIDNVIDYENGTCSFNSPYFVKILEFCNRFIDVEDTGDKTIINEDGYDENSLYYADKLTWFGRDLQMLANVSLDLGNYYNFVKEIQGNGENITLVGYPSEKGDGGRIQVGGIVTISSTCKDKSAAWEFATYYINKMSDNTGLSCLTEKFNKSFDGEVGRKYTFSGLEPTPMSEEDVKLVKDYILSCNSVENDFDTDLWAICQEHAGEYFHGLKTAEEAAEMIQNRASILISEKS